MKFTGQKPKTFSDKLFNLINCSVLIMFSLTVIYPFWHLMVLSFSLPEYSSGLGFKLFPPNPTLESYIHVFKDDLILKAYLNTIIRTVSGTLMSVIIMMCAAYALTKEAMPFKKIINGAILFTAFFGGGLIPTYILIKNLHLNNTLWSLILPSLCEAFYILILGGYIKSIPSSIEESAYIDGASDITTLFRIIIPLCMPVIATVSLWQAVYHWNDWFAPLIYIIDPKKTVLQAILRKIIVDNNVNILVAMNARAQKRQLYSYESIKAAAIIVATGPIVFVYPLAQKFFIKGVYIGAVKG